MLTIAAGAILRLPHFVIWLKPMRTPGVGSRLSMVVVAVAMLGGAGACSTEAGVGTSEGVPPEGVASGKAAPSNAERVGEPEQVVQNMRAPGAGNSERGSAIESGARASAAGMSRANGTSLAPRTNSVETITSKHLEAELNRLEAELAN